MAVKDVKEYYYTVLQQCIDLKADLKDFEESLKLGYITEDKLDDVKLELVRMEENRSRLEYILFLFEIPNKKTKKEKHSKQHKKVLDYFKDKNADKEAILKENESITAKIHKELKALTENK